MTSSDDRLEQALVEDARIWRHEFAPPPLADAMARLDLGETEAASAPSRMPRGRAWWRPFTVAATVLLLVGGAVGLTRRAEVSPTPSGTSTAATSTARPVSLPATYVDRGVTLHLRGTDPVTYAQVSGPSTTTIEVEVRGKLGREVSSCFPLTVPFVTRSSGSEIQLTVGAYSGGGPSATPDEACPDIHPGTRLIPVTLPGPFAGRVVVDGVTGQVVPIGDEGRVPTLGALPAGFVQTAFRSTAPGQTCEAFPLVRACMSRTWTRGHETLVLRPAYGAGVMGWKTEVLASGTVRGAVATVHRVVAPPDNHDVWVDWTGADGVLWQLTVSRTSTDQPVGLSPADLLAVAGSFTPGS